MGKGRKPLPTAIKIAKGTDRRRINQAEPSLAPMSLEPPGYVAGDALEFWNEHCGPMVEAGVLRASDRHSFALLCEAYASWRSEPTRDTISEYRRMLGEFGMTPCSRTKVQVASKPKDALGDFLASKNG